MNIKKYFDIKNFCLLFITQEAMIMFENIIDSTGLNMAGSLNKVMLIGNLGADPEIRTFQNGGKVCNLRIATSDRWRYKNTGEK